MSFEEIISDAIVNNAKAIDQFKAGKEKALNAVMGYVLKQHQDLKPDVVMNAIRAQLGLETRDVFKEKQDRKDEREKQERLECEAREKHLISFGFVDVHTNNMWFEQYGRHGEFYTYTWEKAFPYVRPEDLEVPEKLKKYILSLLVSY